MVLVLAFLVSCRESACCNTGVSVGKMGENATGVRGEVLGGGLPL